LEKLLSNKCSIAKMAKISHRHQLGFLKIIIQVKDTSEYLRLHVWDRLSQVQEDIHSHCAPFQSRVIFGSLTENSYRLSSGNSYAVFRYRFDIDAGHAIAIKNGMTDVDGIETKVLQAGDIYTKHPNELHNVCDPTAGTITVSAWGPRSREALVLKRPDALAEDCIADIGISADELLLILRNILERLRTQ
jgi:hypothetical protein